MPRHWQPSATGVPAALAGWPRATLAAHDGAQRGERGDRGGAPSRRPQLPAAARRALARRRRLGSRHRGPPLPRRAAAYSAPNFGHRHPRVVRAATEQLGRLTLTSRAFHNDQLGGVLRRAERVLRPGPRAADEHRRRGGRDRDQARAQGGPACCSNSLSRCPRAVVASRYTVRGFEARPLPRVTGAPAVRRLPRASARAKLPPGRPCGSGRRGN